MIALGYIFTEIIYLIIIMHIKVKIKFSLITVN
jgi:hypothetical protein